MDEASVVVALAAASSSTNKDESSASLRNRVTAPVSGSGFANKLHLSCRNGLDLLRVDTQM
jgi:hypothetical protein